MDFAIIGTGLIGTSFGLAVHRKRARVRVIGWDARRAHANEARRRGAIDAVAAGFDEAVRGARTVVLASPLGAIVKQIPRALETVGPGSLVLDVGGLQRPAVKASMRMLKGTRALFVAGHPIAGRETSGPRASSAHLFEGRPFVLYAPPQPMRASARRAAEACVRSLGAHPVWLDPAIHDRLIAATSALPQLAAIALAAASLDAGGGPAAHLAGPGFEDATRLADSPFSSWKDNVTGNLPNVRRAVAALARRIGGLARALKAGDAGALAKGFADGAAARRRILGSARRNAATFMEPGARRLGDNRQT